MPWLYQHWHRFILPAALFLMVWGGLAAGQAAFACPCDQIKVPPPADAPERTMGPGLQFAHTAEYKKQFSAAINEAKRFCLEYKHDHPDAKNLAVVSDIDETIVDNREEFRNHPSTFLWSDFEAWMKEARAPVLKESADFLQWARKQGFAIFLVTARPEKERLFTVENLVHDGVSYDGLYLKPDDDKGPSVAYKTGVRKSLEEKGFDIVTNIGDQYSDLIGGYSHDCEKLPNHMYFIK
jgi:predicted secreted acid phosphatase